MTSLCDACKNGFKLCGEGYSARHHCYKKRAMVFAMWAWCDDYEHKGSGN